MPAGLPYDEQFRVYYLAATPADPEAVDAADLGAAVDLSGYLAIDGFAANESDARVDGGDLLTGFDAQAMGREGAEPALTFKRRLKNGDQVAFDTFRERTYGGALVVVPFVGPNDDPEDGDDYRIYTDIDTGRWKMQNTAANTEQRGVVNVAVGGNFYDAILGGGS